MAGRGGNWGPTTKVKVLSLVLRGPASMNRLGAANPGRAESSSAGSTMQVSCLSESFRNGIKEIQTVTQAGKDIGTAAS